MSEHLKRIRKNRLVWGIVAFVVLSAFVYTWTLRNYGTPANPGMPAPVLQTDTPVDAPVSK